MSVGRANFPAPGNGVGVIKGGSRAGTDPAVRDSNFAAAGERSGVHVRREPVGGKEGLLGNARDRVPQVGDPVAPPQGHELAARTVESVIGGSATVGKPLRVSEALRSVVGEGLGGMVLAVEAACLLGA